MHDKPVKEEMKVISMIRLYVRKWSRNGPRSAVPCSLLSGKGEHPDTSHKMIDFGYRTTESQPLLFIDTVFLNLH